MTNSKESSFQIAEFAINHPILAMLVLGLIALIGSICIFALPTGWLPF
jgi:multidrug efflux pump subunit AcrB